MPKSNTKIHPPFFFFWNPEQKSEENDLCAVTEWPAWSRKERSEGFVGVGGEGGALKAFTGIGNISHRWASSSVSLLQRVCVSIYKVRALRHRPRRMVTSGSHFCLLVGKPCLSAMKTGNGDRFGFHSSAFTGFHLSRNLLLATRLKKNDIFYRRESVVVPASHRHSRINVAGKSVDALNGGF